MSTKSTVPGITAFSANGKHAMTKKKLLQTPTYAKNYLTPLGEKIFLDRYAWKDGSKKSLDVGDTVIVCVDEKTRQREIAVVESLDRHEMKAVVRLRDDTTKEVAIEHIDKPLETTPEQTMARIARGIAAVEKADKQAEWQEKFEWLLEDWKFVPGGRIWAGAGTDQELTFYNCMPPSQEVLTESGYRPIAEVNVGDMVVTHRNRLRRVLHKFERETEEPMYVIRPNKVGYDALRVTGEHKILAIRSEWVNKHKSRDGLRLKEEAQWIPAQELKAGDFLAVAYDGATKQAPTLFVSDYILNFEMEDASERSATYTIVDGKISRPQIRRSYHGHLEAGGTHYDIPNEIVVDHEVAYLIGRWLGDGCITHRTGTDIPSGIKITFGLDEATQAEEIADIITRRFGVNARVKVSSTGRWMDVWANSMPLGQFFKALLGCYSYGKSIPATLMHLPDELSLELLRGLFSADGYTSDNKVGILLANRTLAIQIHQLLLRLGYFFSIYENTHRLAKHPSYRLDAAVNECTALFEYFFQRPAPAFDMDLKYYFEHDGLRWVRIKDIATETYKGHVLDIEVDEDHSFISAGVVVSNCYVVPSPHDSRGGIVKTLQQMMEIMSRGGGVGINVSSLRPRYGYVKGVNGRSSGAVSWGGLYSFVTGLIEQGGSRRGALMLICNDWHPDVMEFINSKREAGKITNANISVGISDAFMDAVKADADWDLVFPDTLHPTYDTEWNGDLEAWQAKGYPVIRHKTVKAKEMWNQIIESAWASAEPGLWFRDRANKNSNSWYFNQLICTNPCGEQPLPSFGICNLGAVNLAKFVKDGAVEWETLGKTVRYATRFLDDVIDATPYFFAENAAQQGKERRVGLGVMGLAEMMIRLGLRYGSDEGNAFLDDLFKFFASQAYIASAENAEEKGAFPAFDTEKYLQSGFMLGMPEEVRQTVREKGARNVTLLTVAPTGTTGTMVSTSTGVEPYYFWSYFRKSRLGVHEEVVDVVQAWRDENPGTDLPDYFVTAMDLSPEDHVKVQAVVQKWIDSSISKTCNVPNHYTVEQTAELYQLMYDLGCKGGTIYRDGSRDEQVLNIKKEEPKAAEPAKEAPKAAAPAPYISPNYTNVGDHKRKRARRLKGATYFVHTPVGKAFVTVNRNGEEEPFEVFANVGKVGSEGAAMSEALGRLISLVLRIPSHITPSERLEMVVDQLGGIGGARSIGFGANRVASLPDALAQVLREDLEAHRQDEAAILLGEADPEPHQLELLAVTAQADLCPECGHASFIRIEGCKKCVSCGHAEC